MSQTSILNMVYNKLCAEALKLPLIHSGTIRLAGVGPNFLTKSRAMSTLTDSTDFVLHDIINGKGVLTLNKPKRLNSADLSVVKCVLHKLIEWENKVNMVIVKGNGKAFCAGGDAHSLIKLGPQNHKSTKEFCRTQYTMNGVIGQYPIPYVALIDGITMGAGVGLSVHGPFRIATERTLFAMPETKIGLFPDVGVGYVLSRMPHQLGQYLGLCGQRLKGVDVVKAGIATHYVKSENIPNIYKGLLELNDPKNELKEFLLKNTEDVSNVEFSLTPHLKLIENTFSAPTVEEIITRLQSDGSEFALQTLELLTSMSPISMKISRKLVEIYKNKTLEEGLPIENRLAGAAFEARVSPDLFEGVRALLIDKDQSPKWVPSRLEDVTDEMVDKAFEVLCPEEELNFQSRVNELRSTLQAKM